MQRPPLICLTGIDGCGKSTQARLLQARMEQAGWETASVWTGGRPYISRPLVRLAKHRLHFPKQRDDGVFEARSEDGDPAAEFGNYLSKSNAMFQRHWSLRRGWTDVSLSEHAIEANLAVRPHLQAGRAVICDRYIYKSVVNLAVLLDLELTELPRILRHPAVRSVPRPTLYFLMDLPATVAAERKTDLPSLEYVARRVPVYRALAAYAGMPVIDATQAPEAVSEAIWRYVVDAVPDLV